MAQKIFGWFELCAKSKQPTKRQVCFSCCGGGWFYEGLELHVTVFVFLNGISGPCWQREWSIFLKTHSSKVQNYGFLTFHTAL
jgi:hypothetical protein